MSLSSEQEERFFNAIYSIPYWVKTPDDLLKFIEHLSYRLFQAKERCNAIASFSEDNLTKNEFRALCEVDSKISCEYADIYRNHFPKKRTWDEIQKYNNKECSGLFLDLRE